MFKIASWNVNSINMREEAVLNWLKDTDTDVLLMQELKCVTENFPTLQFGAAGYVSEVLGQKAYNGVGILSKHPIKLISNTLTKTPDEQARFQHVVIKGIHIINIYAPNGNPVQSEKYPYKLAWLDQLITYCQGLLAENIPFLVAGDFNIIPEDIDCYNPADWAEDALFKLESRQKLRILLNMGLSDAFRQLHPKTAHAYTFWDYQQGRWQKDEGIRIDHFLLSPHLAENLKDCMIDRKPRSLEKPSDHTPISTIFDNF